MPQVGNVLQLGNVLQANNVPQVGNLLRNVPQIGLGRNVR